MTLQSLVTWGLGPEPSIKALAHELIVHQREFSFYLETT